MNQFAITDKKGRNKAFKYLQQHLQNYNVTIDNVIEPKSDYAHYDLLITASTQDNKEYYYCIECKDRWGYTSSAFTSDMIEEDKYNNLIERAKTNNEIPLYISTWTDNKATVHNIFKADKFEEHKKRKKQTLIPENGDKNKPCYQLIRNKNTKIIELTTIN